MKLIRLTQRNLSYLRISTATARYASAAAPNPKPSASNQSSDKGHLSETSKKDPNSAYYQEEAETYSEQQHNVDSPLKHKTMKIGSDGEHQAQTEQGALGVDSSENIMKNTSRVDGYGPLNTGQDDAGDSAQQQGRVPVSGVKSDGDFQSVGDQDAMGERLGGTMSNSDTNQDESMTGRLKSLGMKIIDGLNPQKHSASDDGSHTYQEGLKERAENAGQQLKHTAQQGKGYYEDFKDTAKDYGDEAMDRSQDMVDQAKHKASRVADQAKRGAANVTQKVSHAMDDADMKHSAHQEKENLMGKIHHSEEKVKEMAHEAKEAVTGKVKNVAEHIKKDAADAQERLFDDKQEYKRAQHIGLKHKHKD
ncbi:hypothetical protein MP228_003374 [Amoeboaphelidium protococcarum]|nr:hypothetical protein MP228_003374 [Amoeboaphelidium protococcarum]